MANFKRAFWLTTLVVGCLAAGFAGGYLVRGRSGLAGRPVLAQAYRILADHGLQELPPAPVMEYGMIRGMLEAYHDPYTLFVEPPQHELEGNTLQGSFGGIGVRLGRDPEGNWVLYPFPESPAARAGIQDGDRLLAVDGQAITPESAADRLEAAIRGPAGQPVRITVARAPDFTPLELEIRREEFPLPSVSGHLDVGEPRLGVVEVNLIAASTPDELRKAFNDLQARGAQGFALDLRDNGGGLLTAGVDAARLFLKEGIVIQQQYRGQSLETYRVEKPGPLAGVPLVIFVNQHTASAAEIIAGALQAQGRASLIGTRTFGKDTIQLIFDLKDGSSLHVTAAHWWVPGLEAPLAGQGLQPDIPVEAGDPGAAGPAPDPLLQEAIRALFGAQ